MIIKLAVMNKKQYARVLSKQNSILKRTVQGINEKADIALGHAKVNAERRNPNLISEGFPLPNESEYGKPIANKLLVNPPKVTKSNYFPHPEDKQNVRWYHKINKVRENMKNAASEKASKKIIAIKDRFNRHESFVKAKNFKNMKRAGVGLLSAAAIGGTIATIKHFKKKKK